MWRKSCMLGVMSSLSTTQGLLAARAILEETKDEVDSGRVAVGSHR